MITVIMTIAWIVVQAAAAICCTGWLADWPVWLWTAPTWLPLVLWGGGEVFILVIHSDDFGDL